MKILKNNNGIVTVFLCLVMLVIISLIFTLLESARASALSERIQLAVNVATQSAFAAYDRPLFDSYGLLFFTDCMGDGLELSEIAKEYIEKNKADGPGRDWTDFSLESLNTVKHSTATDADGEVFIKAAAEYMRDCGLAAEAIDFAESITNGKDLVSSGNLLNDDGEPDLKKIGEKIKDIESEEAEAEDDPESEVTDKPSEAMDPEDIKEAFETYDGLIEKYNDYKSRGFLALVCKDYEKLSETPYDKTDFPSELQEETKTKTGLKVTPSDSSEKILFYEYILGNLKNYADDGQLQLEYVIAGKDSELANMSSVCKRLIGIRFASNLLFLHSHAYYSGQAEAIALTVSALLQIPGLDNAIKEIILIIWSLAESVEDVKALTGGGKVPLYKSMDDWKLSLENAASGASKTEKGVKGLGYKGYLRILLYLEDSKEAAYKTMDMIQLDIRQTEKAFLMKNCVYAAELCLSAGAGSMFPFLPGTVDYIFKKNCSYGYGTAVDY